MHLCVISRLFNAKGAKVKTKRFEIILYCLVTEKLEDRIFKRLADIDAEGLTRRLKSPRGIDLSSNDFLGLASDERIKEALTEAVARLGVGSTASRLLRGEREEFAAVEREFAEFKRTEKSLYFSSGYQSNIGILQTFVEKNDIVFSDALNHASIIDGLRLAGAQKTVFNHLDFESLAEKLRQTTVKGQKFLVTESLFSMDGTLAPLDKYADLCAETGTNLIIDEAHAVGIYGTRGSGLIEHFGVEEEVFMSLNTAGKALGVGGAFVAGKAWAIEYLIQKCRSFIFSTAPPPALCSALSRALEIIRLEPERRVKLLELSKSLRELLAANGFRVSSVNSQIIPVLIGESEKAVRLSESLQSEGFDVRDIRPPTVPRGTARLRLSLNVNLTEEILREFVKVLVKHFK